MKLQFKHQKFQADAAKAVVDVFAGFNAVVGRGIALADGDGFAVDLDFGHVDEIAVEGLFAVRNAHSGEGHARTERETERTRRTRQDEHTTITEVTPVPPVSSVSPVQPVVIHDTVTNVVERPVPVAEEVQVRVVSLEYDATTCKGILTVEILRGSFKKANKYIRKNFEDLAHKQAPAESAAKIPIGTRLEIESISITDNDLCEVKFAAKSGKE